MVPAFEELQVQWRRQIKAELFQFARYVVRHAQDAVEPGEGAELADSSSWGRGSQPRQRVVLPPGVGVLMFGLCSTRSQEERTLVSYTKPLC